MKIAIYFSAICLTVSSAYAYHDFGYDEFWDRPSRPSRPSRHVARPSRNSMGGGGRKLVKIRPPPPRPRGSTGVPNKPTKFGVVIYPGFQALDVFGPLDILNTLSETVKMELSLISKTWEPVSTKGPEMKNIRNVGSNFAQMVWPTATFGTAAKDLEVLIVPGGIGAFKIDQGYVDYIRDMYPKLRYLITVGTGSAVVAKTGHLDNRRVTSSKAIWQWAVTQGRNVNWVREARWVVDGNIWSSSGRTAGMDATFAFLNEVYGSENSTNVANLLEYPRHKRSSWDPYSNVWKTTNSNFTMTPEDKDRNNFM